MEPATVGILFCIILILSFFRKNKFIAIIFYPLYFIMSIIGGGFFIRISDEKIKERRKIFYKNLKDSFKNKDTSKTVKEQSKNEQIQDANET